MVVAIIPARIGSKRIPKKNIRPFLGKPMISYAIKAAQDSGVFDRIIVSTDSEEIAEVARNYRVEVPFLRPAKLADDFTPTKDVLDHAIEWLKANDVAPKYFCCIYPTAPLLVGTDLKKAYEQMIENDAPGVFSVTPFGYTPFRALAMNSKGQLQMIWPENELKRSNDLPVAFHDAGQFYWFQLKNYEKTKKIWELGAEAYALPRHLVQDIDTPEDWVLAEKLYEAFRA